MTIKDFNPFDIEMIKRDDIEKIRNIPLKFIEDMRKERDEEIFNILINAEENHANPTEQIPKFLKRSSKEVFIP